MPEAVTACLIMIIIIHTLSLDTLSRKETIFKCVYSWHIGLNNCYTLLVIQTKNKYSVEKQF